MQDFSFTAFSHPLLLFKKSVSRTHYYKNEQNSVMQEMKVGYVLCTHARKFYFQTKQQLNFYEIALIFIAHFITICVQVCITVCYFTGSTENIYWCIFILKVYRVYCFSLNDRRNNQNLDLQNYFFSLNCTEMVSDRVFS